MIVTHSKNNIPIRITQERWEYIERRHPEMAGQKEKVVETISNPDLIQIGDFEEKLAIKPFRKLLSQKNIWSLLTRKCRTRMGLF